MFFHLVVLAAVATPTSHTAMLPSGPGTHMAQAIELQSLKDRGTAALARALAEPRVAEALVAELQQHPEGRALADLNATLLATNAELAAVLRDSKRAGDAVPEVWLHVPETGDVEIEDLLVASVPAGEEKTWTRIKAYDRDLRLVELDPMVAPEQPVLVFETHGRLAMRRGIEQANALLQLAGLQKPEAATPKTTPRATEIATPGTWTMRLDQIRLEDDQEPWISGRAEIYAISSGVVGENDPVLRLVELPYLDYADETYYPNQILLDWADFAYQAANIQFFEHDDNTNYQDLVVAIVEALAAMGSLAGYPEVSALLEIAARILAAMPAHWWSNDDDYVDSFYTLEKYVTYQGRWGVSNNAKATFTPYYLEANEP